MEIARGSEWKWSNEEDGAGGECQEPREGDDKPMRRKREHKPCPESRAPLRSVMPNDKLGGCLVSCVLSLESIGRSFRPFQYSSGVGSTGSYRRDLWTHGSCGTENGLWIHICRTAFPFKGWGCRVSVNLTALTCDRGSWQ